MAAKNDLPSRPLYDGRKLYEEFYESENPEYVDLRGKRLFYGKVDFDFNAVALRNESFLKNFKQKKSVRALNFVVDAFEDFKKYIKVCENRLPGFVLTEEDFLKDMVVKKGWHNVNQGYADFMSTYNILFNTSYIPQHGLDKKIKNLDDYVGHFMDFYDITEAISPITRTTFVLSRFSGHNSSGLMLELEDLDHSEDTVKIDKYYNNRHFGFYVKAARKFGFVVDKNAPWRLVANIVAPNMRRYLKKYVTPEALLTATREGLSTADAEAAKAAAIRAEEEAARAIARQVLADWLPPARLLFERYFVKTYLTDAETLKRYMIIYYNLYARANPATETYVSGDGRLFCTKKIILRKTVDYGAYLRDGSGGPSAAATNNFTFTDKYWLPRYYYLRSLEAGKKIGRRRMSNETRKITQLSNFLDIDRALSYINEEVKTTFRKSAFTRGPEAPLQPLPALQKSDRQFELEGLDAPNILELIKDEFNINS